MGRIRTKAVGAAAAFAAAGAMGVAVSPAAQAVPARPSCTPNPRTGSCYPLCATSGCNHTDSYAMGCDVGAYRVFPRDGNGLELWWSPACQTNWTVLYTNRPATFYVERATPHDTASESSQSDGGWTDQLYAPGAARASVSFWREPVYDGPYYTPWTS